MKMRLLISPLLACGLLIACAEDSESGVPKGEKIAPPDFGPIETEPLPEGAIQVGEDLYMVPLADPVDGCQGYYAFSRTKLTTQEIRYRRPDGSFTALREQADCGDSE